MFTDTFAVAFAEQILGAFYFLIVGYFAWVLHHDPLAELQDHFIHVIESECNYLKSGQLVGLIFFQNSIYFLISAFFSWYDNKNEKTQTLSIKRLVNPGRRPLKKVQWDLVRLATHTAFLNGNLSGIVYCIVYLQGYRFRGCCDAIFAENINTATDWIILIIKLLLIVPVADFTFYFGHRLYHESKFLYQKFHKFHHQWVDSYAIAAIAAHPVEFITANLAVLHLPIIILGIPAGLGYAWCFLGMINTLHSHCGYHEVVKVNVFGKAVSIGGVPHDFHHHFQSTEFGAGGIADWLFKTRMQDKFPKAWAKLITLYEFD